jgi:hypothetical protein
MTGQISLENREPIRQGQGRGESGPRRFCYPRKQLLATLALLLLASTAPGQGRRGRPRVTPEPLPQVSGRPGEFTFVRTIYHSRFRDRGMGSWSTDFPAADYHFIAGIRFWSGANLDISPRPEQIQILDEKIFEYPLIYFVEPGYLELSDEEARKLREYALRGGFLFLDDFWGQYEWENVREQMRRVFPEWVIEDLPLDHPVFHTYFDIDAVVQVPGIGAWLGRGVTYEKDGIVPHYMGIQNGEGRLVAFIARNCDLGDAWEWIDDRRYPIDYGLAAYRIGIDIIAYAMTR